LSKEREEWARTKTLQLEEAAREILLRFPEPVSTYVPEDVPLFVYNPAEGGVAVEMIL
jgi:hypothetical protein